VDADVEIPPDSQAKQLPTAGRNLPRRLAAPMSGAGTESRVAQGGAGGGRLPGVLAFAQLLGVEQGYDLSIDRGVTRKARRAYDSRTRMSGSGRA